MAEDGFLTEDLQARVDALSPEKRALFAQLLAERSSPGVHELAVTQQGLWFLDKVNPRSPMYTIAWRCELRGHLDSDAFRRAVDVVTGRHDALRTRFDVVDGRPAQVIDRGVRIPISVEDLTDRPEAERAPLVDTRIRALTDVGFDLSRSPLVRVALFRLAVDRHVMLLMAHHIVFDYVSTDIFLSELIRAYRAEVGAGPADLPPLPIQYADFARWQRGHLHGERLAALTEYWTRQLAGADNVIDLPTDRPRPAGQTFRGAAYEFEIPPEVIEPLRAVARLDRATLFMVYLAGFQALLHRYCGASAVSVGLAVDARTRAELRPLIGFFINSVVVRTDVSGNPSFLDLLDRVRRACLDAYEHHELPFDQVVEAVAPTRSLSSNPLFQVTCALDDDVSHGLSGGGIEVVSLDGLHTGRAKFDLSFGGTLREGRAKVTVDYNRDLFDESTVARMGRHFVALLTAVGKNPRLVIGELPLIDDRDVLELMAWSAPPVAGGPPDPLAAFYRQAAARPDALAVDDAGTQLSYSELVQRVAAAVCRLAAAGVGTGTVAGIASPRGIDQLVGVLAVLHLGAVVAPADAAPSVDVVVDTVAEVEVEVEAGGVAAGGGGAGVLGSPVPVPARQTAYLASTAGASGPARTVEVSRAALAAAVAGHAAALGVRPTDRLAWLADLGTDEAVTTICLALSAGASLCAVADPTAGAVAVAVREGRVTAAVVPPVLARRLTAATLADLRTAVAVGDVLVGAAGHRWAGGGRLVRGYSTTGTGIAAWTAEKVDDSGSVLLGRPVPGARLYVLDDSLRPQPVGIPGEVYVGGAGVALGYRGMPGRTAADFVPDPFAAEPGARMLRTGDLARWRADGTLMFVGRTGMPWCETAGRPIPYVRIAAAITAHPAVADAVVVVSGRGRSRPIRTAYVVPETGATLPDLRELQRFLAPAIPDYLMPGAMVVLERLPEGPTGRVDVAALVPPDDSTTRRRTVGPRTAAERVLTGAWSQMLAADDIGVDDSFFDLGGHSLLAVQLLTYVGELFGVELEMSVLFRAATPAAMAAELAERLGGVAAAESAATAVEAVLSMSDDELAARLAEVDAAAAKEAP